MKKSILKKSLIAIVTVVVIYAVGYIYNNSSNVSSIIDDDSVIPTTVPASESEISGEPQDHSALGGYDVLIADRGNNRIIEVTPDKKIVWQYNFILPKFGLGADDAFFTDNGKSITVNLELYHVVQKIDFESKKVVWGYGIPGVAGKEDGFLDRPDDAYQLPNGDIMTADIKNFRVIEISPDKKIVR